MNFQQAAELCLKEQAIGRKKSSIYQYRAILDAHLIPAIGGQELAAVTAGDLKAFLGAKIEKGYRRATLQKIMAVAHIVFRWAEERGEIQDNPAKGLRRLISMARQEEEPREKALDSAQLAVFLESAKADDSPFGRLFQFMVLTGIRPGEAIALRWEDVAQKPTGFFLTISRTVTRPGQGDFLDGAWVSSPKGRRKRAIPLSKPAIKLLLKMREGAVGPWVIRKANGTPYSMNRLCDAFRRIQETAGISGFTPHALRHTCASNLVRLGVDAATGAGMLGHKRPSFFYDVYAKHLPDLEGAADKLAVLMDYTPSNPEI